MNTVMNLLKEWAKTIAAFVGTVLTNMIVSLVNGSSPWPQTSAEWIQYAVTSIGAALAVYSVRNKITQKQLDKDPHVIGGIVVPDVPRPTSPPPPASDDDYVNPF